LYSCPALHAHGDSNSSFKTSEKNNNFKNQPVIIISSSERPRPKKIPAMAVFCQDKSQMLNRGLRWWAMQEKDCGKSRDNGAATSTAKTSVVLLLHHQLYCLTAEICHLSLRSVGIIPDLF
jgi:hypothetical protein